MKTLYNHLWRISHHYLGDEEQNNPTFLYDFIHLAVVSFDWWHVVFILHFLWSIFDPQKEMYLYPYILSSLFWQFLWIHLTSDNLKLANLNKKPNNFDFIRILSKTLQWISTVIVELLILWVCYQYCMHSTLNIYSRIKYLFDINANIDMILFNSVIWLTCIWSFVHFRTDLIY